MVLLSQWVITVSICILSSAVLFHLAVANSFQQSFTHTCHDDEISVLLQLKQTFVIDGEYCRARFKTSSWKPTINCCSWKGVECDEETGHVIGLDLSDGCLYGSINTSSTLFRLVHLERLNLAGNNFSSSHIPRTIRNFSRLRYLNLSNSFFSGQVPSELSQLTKLSSLDMSGNFFPFANKGFLRNLAQNLTRLETLDLSYINMSSTVPHIFANLSHLTSLRLHDCGLFGEFPVRIFRLQNLKVLSVANNPALTGYIPDEYNGTSPHLMSLKLDSTNIFINLPALIERFLSLKELDLSSCNIPEGPLPVSLGHLRDLVFLDLTSNKFKGPIPAAALGNLTQLTYLSLSGNSFHGPIPAAALGNLTQLTDLSLSWNSFHGPIPAALGNLTQLTYLALHSNSFQGPIPAAALGSLTQLTYLALDSNSFQGPIPAALGSLTQLRYLTLDSNSFHGPIPAALGNLTQLFYLSLSWNSFHSPIPQSFFNLLNLRTLRLDHNNLSDTVGLQKFLNLRKLTDLDLSYNNLELLPEPKFLNNATTVLPKLSHLTLSGCNIREFPNFLRFQESLLWLDLSRNKLQGQVPKWMFNTSTSIDISHNDLSSFADQVSDVLPRVNLDYVDLSYNLFGELLLLPTTNLSYYAISNNKLTGQAPSWICNLTSLQHFDLSNNNLSGLPQCLENSDYYLRYLNLANNSFHGNFPEAFINGGELQMVDISRNNFHGPLPKSLANCANLRSLMLSHNKFTGTFPVWLGSLPELSILTMDHNGFYGLIAKPKKKNMHFPVLRILDLSSNNFSGRFPFEYIFSGNGTTSITHDLEYFFDTYFGAYYSITITSKGVERYYPKVRQDLILIDISSNNFEGKIPEFIGKLKAIWSLNISNNILTGNIPASLSNLSRLESLDLSHNKLSGEIPQQLAKLDWLQKFNVSYNNLTGPIPRGHFTTFDNTSYLENPGLCGDILLTKCFDNVIPRVPPSGVGNNGFESGGIELSWKFVLAGAVSGLVVGVVLADVAVSRWPEWFSMIVGMLIRQMRRRS